MHRSKTERPSAAADVSTARDGDALIALVNRVVSLARRAVATVTGVGARGGRIASARIGDVDRNALGWRLLGQRGCRHRRGNDDRDADGEHVPHRPGGY